MLKTAAMSLLSKTLQTFLYKYLSDVDVEGVALPSVYDGSGWGVRLSNVKLREGVQLMEKMPGKRMKKRKRTKKKRKPKDPVRSNAPVEESASYREEAALPQESLHAEGYDFPDEPPQTPPRRQRERNAARSREQDDDLIESSLHFNDMGNLRPTRSRTASTDELEVSVDDGGHASPTSRPSTPLQDSKSIFSCFTKGKGKGGTTAQEGDSNTAGTMSDAPSMGYYGDDSSTNPPVSVVQETPLNRQVSALAMEEKRYPDEKDETARDDPIGEEEEEESDSEDEFEDYEQPYRLCLGDNGRIGTLDIR
jgi:hypothetical protein